MNKVITKLHVLIIFKKKSGGGGLGWGHFKCLNKELAGWNLQIQSKTSTHEQY